MSVLLPSRRGFILGAAGIVAAPAIIKASSLMRISAPRILHLHRNILSFYGSDDGTKFSLLAKASAGWLYSTDGVGFKPLRGGEVVTDYVVRTGELSAYLKIHGEHGRRFDQVHFC